MTPKQKKIIARESLILVAITTLMWFFNKGFLHAPFINRIFRIYNFENSFSGFIRFYIFIRFTIWLLQSLILRIRMKSGLFPSAEKAKMKEESRKETERVNWVPYFLLLAMAVFTSLFLMYIYAYFITGSFKTAVKTSENMINSHDPLFLNSIWVIFLVSLIISFMVKRYLKNSHRCSVCGNLGRDLLNTGDKKAKRFCRNHLIEEFRQKFLNFDHKMVVVYPGIEGRKQSYYYTYGYYTKADLKKYNLSDIAGSLLERGLQSISGKCNKCGVAVNIAYFGKESFQWKDDFPTIDKIIQKPEVMCNKCTVDLIIPSLRGFKGNFVNPVEIPRKDEGILFPWTQ